MMENFGLGTHASPMTTEILMGILLSSYSETSYEKTQPNNLFKHENIDQAQYIDANSRSDLDGSRRP